MTQSVLSISHGSFKLEIDMLTFYSSETKQYTTTKLNILLQVNPYKIFNFTGDNFDSTSRLLNRLSKNDE